MQKLKLALLLLIHLKNKMLQGKICFSLNHKNIEKFKPLNHNQTTSTIKT